MRLRKSRRTYEVGATTGAAPAPSATHVIVGASIEEMSGWVERRAVELLLEHASLARTWGGLRGIDSFGAYEWAVQQGLHMYSMRRHHRELRGWHMVGEKPVLREWAAHPIIFRVPLTEGSPGWRWNGGAWVRWWTAMYRNMPPPRPGKPPRGWVDLDKDIPF